MGKSKLMMLCFLTLSISCIRKNEEVDFYRQKLDSIIYVLPDSTTKIISDFLIEDRDICYCGLLSNSSKNEYIFSFNYISCKKIRSEKINQLLKKTNRYLKIGDKQIPIISIEDELFSSSPSDSVKFIHGFNYAFISVNAEGDILDLGIWQ